METRETIRSLLRAQPGLSTRAVARRLGVDDSTADYHLRRMRKMGQATCSGRGRELLWFEAGCGLCPLLKRAVPAFRRTEVAHVALALDDVPTSVARLATRTGVPPGAVRWTGSVLVEMGIASKSRTGRLALAAGAEECVGKAANGERCDRWGRCSMSRRLQGQAVVECP